MPPKKSNSSLPKSALRFFQKTGSKGGKAGTGEAKARSSEQARKASKARWDKYRAEKAQEQKKGNESTAD